jgi:amidase
MTFTTKTEGASVIPLLVLALAGCDPAPASDETTGSGFDPSGLSLEQLEQALDKGEITSVELVDYCLSGINKLDKQGPELNAVIKINGQARQQAEALDKDRKSAANRGPLYGIPFVVKDNYDVVGMATTGGSVALASNYPASSSTVVQRLMDAGAIVLAKTNMSELAASYGRLGYSSLGGLTLNPYDLKRNTSGSSSGTAAAVAAGFAPFGLGTDTSGSIRGPASVTGLVGIRPTLGLTSRHGVIPLSLSFDTTAPMAHSVSDAATVLQAMAGSDPEDPATSSADAAPHDYVKALDSSSLKGARLGVLRSFFGGNEEVDKAVNDAIDRMSGQGATVVPVDLGDEYKSLWNDILGPVGDMEFASEFETYLSTSPAGTPKTLDDLISLSTSKGVTDSATPVNPARIDGFLAAASARSLLGGPEYTQLTTVDMPKIRQHILDEMKSLDLDALVFPTMSCVASPRFDQDDPTYQCDADDPYAASYISSASGLPEVTVPVGSDAQGLPIGMSFLGGVSAEQTILNLAYSWEQAADVKLAPGAIE